MTTTPSTPNQKVFTAPEIFVWSDALADLLKRMRESDRAIFLIRNADDRQVWVNDQAAEIMRSSGEECVIRRVSDYWKPEDLHALSQRPRRMGKTYGSLRNRKS
jgi:PAS domain-containing protein